jgi:hypothetical protein
VSNAFVDTLRYGSTLLLARFTVYVKGTPEGTPYLASASTGTFTIDRNSEQRRTGSITIEVVPTVPPPPLVPTNPQSLLAPFGNEIFVEEGITATGDVADVTWTSLGLYAIATSTADDTSIDLVFTLTLYDRSWTIAQRTFKQPYNFPATASGNFVDEIVALLTGVWGQQQGVQPLVFHIVPTTQTVPTASYEQGSDPWQAALDMAAACGYELYFDINGQVMGKPIPNPMTQPVIWNFTDDLTSILGYGGTGSGALFGSPYSTPVECSVQMTRDGIFNDIIIQGTGDANAATYNGDGIETSAPPALAEAADTNPQSPTYIGGAMGDVPDFISTSLTSAPGAVAMANEELAVTLSSSWTVTLAIPPNTLFDVDQVCSVTRPRLGLNNILMVLDTITDVLHYSDTCALTGRVIGGI